MVLNLLGPSSGNLVSAPDTPTGKEVAVRLVRAQSQHPTLLPGATTLHHLLSEPGVANVHYRDVEGAFQVVVLGLQHSGCAGRPDTGFEELFSEGCPSPLQQCYVVAPAR